jgi:hypothetical protein
MLENAGPGLVLSPRDSLSGHSEWIALLKSPRSASVSRPGFPDRWSLIAGHRELAWESAKSRAKRAKTGWKMFSDVQKHAPDPVLT